MFIKFWILGWVMTSTMGVIAALIMDPDLEVDKKMVVAVGVNFLTWPLEIIVLMAIFIKDIMDGR